MAAAGSSADHAAAYISSMAGRGVAGSSADPGGAPANPDVIWTRGVRRYGRLLSRAADSPSSTASDSSTHGQVVGSIDPHGASGGHDKPASDRPSSASPVNRPFTRHARSAATNAAVSNPDSGGDGHAQIVRQLLASRDRSKADRAPDVAAAGSQAAQPRYGESAALVSSAPSLAAQAKSDDTASLLPAESASHSPMQSLRPRDWFMEKHRQEVRRICRGQFRAQPDGLSPRADRPDTTASAEPVIVAATAKLASITPAVSLTEHHTSSNTVALSHSCSQTSAGAPEAQGGLQDNLMGSQGGSQIIPLGSGGGMPNSGSCEDVSPGSQGGTQDPLSGSQGATRDDLSGSAAAMPPPAPCQPAETAANLLWSLSSHNRDMHSLGAGLLDFPDRSGDRPRQESVKPLDPSGSETTQSFRHALQQAVGKEPLDRLFPDGLTDWAPSSSADKAPLLSSEAC